MSKKRSYSAGSASGADRFRKLPKPTLFAACLGVWLVAPDVIPSVETWEGWTSGFASSHLLSLSLCKPIMDGVVTEPAGGLAPVRAARIKGGSSRILLRARGMTANTTNARIGRYRGEPVVIDGAKTRLTNVLTRLCKLICSDAGTPAQRQVSLHASLRSQGYFIALQEPWQWVDVRISKSKPTSITPYRPRLLTDCLAGVVNRHLCLQSSKGSTDTS